MKPLSSYTIASNCTDLTDLGDGIEEIREVIRVYVDRDRKIPLYFYVRLGKLKRKLEKLQQRQERPPQTKNKNDHD